MGDIFLGTRKIPPWKIAPRRIAPQHITPLEDCPRKIPNHVNSPLKIPTHSDSSGRLHPPGIIPNYIYLNSTLKNPTNENSLPPQKKKDSLVSIQIGHRKFPEKPHPCMQSLLSKITALALFVMGVVPINVP